MNNNNNSNRKKYNKCISNTKVSSNSITESCNVKQNKSMKSVI